ncbi:MAG: prephenate dehydratase [Firmicutes bacterium]|nr:prephenate dehydratase [Bacillota bacterium]
MACFFSGRDYEGIPFSDIQELIQSVCAGEISFAVVPVENSLEGTINVTLDLLVREDGVHIAGEVILPVVHHLLARPGSRQFTKVLSHPHALSQCREYLQRQMPGAVREATSSTAEAARLVGSSKEPWAAIGTEEAARRYGLEVVARAIQDTTENETRFLIIGQQPAPKTGRDKTSVAFSLIHDRPGTLYGALGEFANRGINLTKIESRPARRSIGYYIFFIDCEGHREDPAVAEAIEAIKEGSTFFKVLGSYPRWGG